MLPINIPWIGDEEKAEVLKVIDEVALTSAASEGGKRVRDLEASLREFLGAKHVIAVNSGTAALQAALMAAGVHGRYAEVLLPSFTFVATANAVKSVGAKPIFLDINDDDYTINIEDFLRKVNYNTRAVIPVHLYGHPVDMERLKEAIMMAVIENKIHEDQVVIIEDACQSIGSTFRGIQTGRFGLMGCFSLYASKVLTSGEGGMIATDDDDMAARLRMIRNHGMTHGYDTSVLGLNLRLPEVCAAIAKVQMTKLQKMLDMRRHNATLLSELLQHPKVACPPIDDHRRGCNWYLYTVQFNSHEQREYTKVELAKNGISSAVYYDPPVHKTPYYAPIAKQWTGDTLKVTERCAERVLSLPVHPQVHDEDIRLIAKVVLDSLH